MPQFQTLVFIEATQYMISDSSVWRVQVWRVTLVSEVRKDGQPAANRSSARGAIRFSGQNFCNSNYIISCTRRKRNEDVDGTL